jgi:plastocyanin
VNQGLRRSLSVVAVALMLTALLAACGTSSDEAEPTVTRIAVEGAPPTRTATVPGGEEAASPAPVTGESPVGTPAGGGGEAAGGPIEVDMVDALAFDPPEITIPANTDVTIHAVNSGALPHTFTITDVADTGEVAGGASADVTVNLKPGEYEYFCAIPGHKDAGMVGKLIVQ